MVRQLRAETGEKHGTLQRVATQLGCGVESLRLWVNQDQIDHAEATGTSTEDSQRIRELEQEVRELRRANAILKSASAFFPAELDRPQKRWSATSTNTGERFGVEPICTTLQVAPSTYYSAKSRAPLRPLYPRRRAQGEPARPVEGEL